MTKVNFQALSDAQVFKTYIKTALLRFSEFDQSNSVDTHRDTDHSRDEGFPADSRRFAVRFSLRKTPPT